MESAEEGATMPVRGDQTDTPVLTTVQTLATPNSGNQATRALALPSTTGTIKIVALGTFYYTLGSSSADANTATTSKFIHYASHGPLYLTPRSSDAATHISFYADSDFTIRLWEVV